MRKVSLGSMLLAAIVSCTSEDVRHVQGRWQHTSDKIKKETVDGTFDAVDRRAEKIPKLIEEGFEETEEAIEKGIKKIKEELE